MTLIFSGLAVWFPGQKRGHFLYCLPELVEGEVPVNTGTIRRLLKKEPVQVQFDLAVEIDALSGATWIEKQTK